MFLILFPCAWLWPLVSSQIIVEQHATSQQSETASNALDSPRLVGSLNPSAPINEVWSVLTRFCSIGIVPRYNYSEQDKRGSSEEVAGGTIGYTMGGWAGRGRRVCPSIECQSVECLRSPGHFRVGNTHYRAAHVLHAPHYGHQN
ncbi:hypothetical protein F5888DRAFT_565575 [Russula emetica]|nr:hypothetical protein F5888DRAFT_565575 [Russula emetica]